MRGRCRSPGGPSSCGCCRAAANCFRRWWRRSTAPRTRCGWRPISSTSQGQARGGVCAGAGGAARREREGAWSTASAAPPCRRRGGTFAGQRASTGASMRRWGGWACCGRAAGGGCIASCAWWTSRSPSAAASTSWTISTIPTMAVAAGAALGLCRAGDRAAGGRGRRPPWRNCGCACRRCATSARPGWPAPWIRCALPAPRARPAARRRAPAPRQPTAARRAGAARQPAQPRAHRTRLPPRDRPGARGNHHRQRLLRAGPQDAPGAGGRGAARA